jgi:ankyrin repeat protein
MMEFLNLLADDSYLDLDIADAQNWTVLDRVAAVGTAKEVRRLIELGANPYQEAAPLRWTAIHQAVFHGNLATLAELLPEYGDTARYMVDDRGWTLLHIAASAGHTEILRHLLKAGADPDAKSKPYDSHMPELLFNRSCTPQEVAAAQSSEREKEFLDALHEQRLSTGYVIIPSDSDSEDEQEFCEAKEYAT